MRAGRGSSQAWRPTNVVGERHPAQSLPSRRSHRRKKNQRNSGRLNRSKVKLIKRINQKWRWKNRWRIRRLKLQKKAWSQGIESPGKTSIEGSSSPNLEAREDDETGSLDSDLTANTESTDTVKKAEKTQHGTQEHNRPIQKTATRWKMRNQLRKAIIASTKNQAPLLAPLHQGGASPPSPQASSRWLNAKGEQQHTQRQRAKHINNRATPRGLPQPDKKSQPW